MPKFLKKPVPLPLFKGEPLPDPAAFPSLIRQIGGCRACPRMVAAGRSPVFSGKCGRPGSPVLFIAEAPGRNGADRTGIPLHGDPSGAAFETMLKAAGWTRADVFVTNAVLCNPIDEVTGNNRPPDQAEVENCSNNLRNQIMVIRPVVLATVGGKALEALKMVFPHDIRLGTAVGSPQEIRAWDRVVWVFPLYHPSPRAMIHRSMTKQTEDFLRLRNFVKSLVLT